jgi:hypothetical protein
MKSRSKTERAVLKVVTYPGHQGPPVQNNVNLVITPEDFTVVHTGDQSGDEDPGHDFDWLAHIGHNHRVDVLLSNGWTNDLHRIVRGVNPQLVIPGHQNEMTHEVSHREEYTQDYERMFGLHYPYIVMAWGESFLYRRPAEGYRGIAGRKLIFLPVIGEGADHGFQPFPISGRRFRFLLAAGVNCLQKTLDDREGLQPHELAMYFISVSPYCRYEPEGC